MKNYKKSIHIWITLTSLAGFLSGWAFLAQASRVAAKQVSASMQTMVSLAPIPTIDNLSQTATIDTNSMQVYRINPATPTPLPQPTPQPQPLFFAQPLKTGGS